jgi:hypothetical protein
MSEGDGFVEIVYANDILLAQNLSDVKPTSEAKDDDGTIVAVRK